MKPYIPILLSASVSSSLISPLSASYQQFPHYHVCVRGIDALIQHINKKVPFSIICNYIAPFLYADHAHLLNSTRIDTYKVQCLFSPNLSRNAYYKKGFMNTIYYDSRATSRSEPISVTPKMLINTLKRESLYFYPPHIIFLSSKHTIQLHNGSFSLRMGHNIHTYTLSCMITMPEDFQTDVTQNPAIFIPDSLYTTFKQCNKRGEFLMLSSRLRAASCYGLAYNNFL